MFRGDTQEFRLRDLKGKLLMAFSADIARGFAANRDDAWSWVGGRTLRAGWYECAEWALAVLKRGSEVKLPWQHVNWDTALEI